MKVEVPIKTVSEANKRGHHWSAKRDRVAKQRRRALLGLLSLGKPPSPPLVVTLTRIIGKYGKRYDPGDNLPASLKAVRDAVADWLGVDDRYEDLVRYEYAQEKGTAYAVRIEIEQRNKDNNDG